MGQGSEKSNHEMSLRWPGTLNGVAVCVSKFALSVRNHDPRINPRTRDAQQAFIFEWPSHRDMLE